MSNPKTLKELCAAATPGPYDYNGGGWVQNKDFTPIANFNFGAAKCANAELIARLSPEVVLQVYQSLVELCGLIDCDRTVYPDIPHQNAQRRARIALAALDGVKEDAL
jgi:hypothetical protein